MPVVVGTKEGVKLFTITNRSGVELSCTSLGATITGLRLPDGTDILLGFENIKDYFTNPPYIGCSVGRCANRIREAQFTLDGHTHQLSANVAPHHLHGGKQGFHTLEWSVAAVGDNHVTLEHCSHAGVDGYPGNLTARVTYDLLDSDEVSIEYSATTDAPTIVNLVNHTYFNLAGKGTIHDHLLTINGDSYHPLDEALVPFGSLEPVAGTALDFLSPTPIGQRMADVGGYDYNYSLVGVRQTHPSDHTLKHAATLQDPGTGHQVRVFTDQPGVQLYTGNFLDGSLVGKDGKPIGKHGGVCLETQAWPNAINNPAATEQVILRPGGQYCSRTRWQLGWPSKQQLQD